MAIIPAGTRDGLAELDVAGVTAESVGRLLDGQRELFHSQIEQLQRLVVAQCRLTGVNPLAQEMAAGALSIKIGKRPRDLLNPKAINYMQSVFSIKDTIGKKETREISALCGVTVTQVREFLAGQRSRFRKLVRLSHEKAIRKDKASSDGCSTSSDQVLSIETEPSVHAADTMAAENSTQVPENLGINIPVQGGQQIPINSTDLKAVEGASSSLEEETIPGVDSEDKRFLENIFSLMKNEETFSGQVKLMEWVLQIQNTAILNWFLTKGGITILATWLNQAAVEEQTTVLLVIFKVLCHLPLHKALPLQMSAILQIVNRLRFYRTSDISNRARILLSRWSKLFVRNHALKKPIMNSSNNAQKEIIRKQRISAILSDESWKSKIDIPEEILALSESTENGRKAEPGQMLKLLPASSDASAKKHGRSVSSPKTKERRKVQLVEQPDRKTAGRSVLVARAIAPNHSRPISADDIQKAKMRAIFLQDKYGKTDASTSENQPQKTEDQKAPCASQPNKILPTSRVPNLPQLRRHEDKRTSVPTLKASPLKVDASVNSNHISSHMPSWDKLKSDEIQWQTPPEMKIDNLWRVGIGDSSKEVEVQTERIRREKETIYACQEDIPPNPKEPWDTEMDFDDSLTLEIPTEQPLDVDVADGSPPSPSSLTENVDVSVDTPATASATPVGNSLPEPDLELLAVLLKNPDLVFALTSGQGSNLNSEQMVALLDMLKKNGIGLTGVMNGMVGSSKEKAEPVSLPSPTPPSERNGWRSEASPFTKNPPPLQPQIPGIRGATALPSAVALIPPLASTSMAVRTQAAGLGLPSQALQTPTPALPLSIQAPAASTPMPQLTVTINPSQHLPVLNSVISSIASTSTRGLSPHAGLPPTMYPLHESPDGMLHTKRHSATSHAAGTPLVLQESVNFGQAHKRSPSPSAPLYPTLHPTLLRPPPPVQTPHAHPVASPTVPRWPPRAAVVGQRNPTSDPWNSQSSLSSGVPGPDPRSFANPNNYGMYPKGPARQPAVIPGHTRERSELRGAVELETWSPDGSPVRSLDPHSSRVFSDSRRDHGWGHRPQRRWNPSYRDRQRPGSSGKRR